jgi:hypothetical protein
MLLTQNMRDDSETIPKAIHMYEESRVTSAMQSLEKVHTLHERNRRIILTISTAVQVSIKTNTG